MILWKNAKFYTMEKEDEYTNKLITNNGVIVALGDECNLYKPSQVIDLKGSFVFPGFSEAHLHLIGYGRKLNSNNLNLNKNKDEVLMMISNFYKNQILKVEGYFNIGLTKDDLDLISTNHYIILRHNDYHSYTVNSKVLNDLNIESVTGIITNDFISEKVNKLWENNSKDNLIKFTNDAINSLKSLGFTSVHTDDLSYFNSYDETLNILNDASFKHHFRINTLIHHHVINNYLNGIYPNNKLLKPIQFKFFYDGTISSKTALLSDNYFNESHNGMQYINDLEFIKQLKEIRKINKGVAVHVIGDQALVNVLKLLKTVPKTLEQDRIVHGSLAPLNIKIDIPIDIQPSFKIEDEQLINNNIKFDILKYPFNIYNKQTIINSSSDAPVSNPNPLKIIYLLDEISRYDAIKSYTVNPYLTINQNGGLIKKGYLADFTCFDQDILKIDKEKLLQTKVKYTIIDEHINNY